MRASDVVRRIDEAIVAEVQAERAVIVRRSRQIGAVVTDIVQAAKEEVAMTRSRIPDGTC